MPGEMLNQTNSRVGECRIKKNCRQFALAGTCGESGCFVPRVGCRTQRYPLSAAQCHVQRIFTAPKFPSQDILSEICNYFLKIPVSHLNPSFSGRTEDPLFDYVVTISSMECFSGYLPPAYVRTTGGYVFTGVCLFNFRGGYPVPSLGRGVPHLRSGRGGYPLPGLARGVPPQSWDGVPPGPGMGYPSPRPGMGYPPRPGMGTPPGFEMGYPPRPEMVRWGIPPRPISIASICYAAGGMPLAFTQEDFLVLVHVFFFF